MPKPKDNEATNYVSPLDLEHLDYGAIVERETIMEEITHELMMLHEM